MANASTNISALHFLLPLYKTAAVYIHGFRSQN